MTAEIVINAAGAELALVVVTAGLVFVTSLYVIETHKLVGAPTFEAAVPL
jgi:hypothetical protein